MGVTADAGSLVARLAAVRARMHTAQRAAARPPGSVGLLAVSKGHPPAAVRTLAGLGQRAFGESYLRECLSKMDATADLDLEWHFIGRLQRRQLGALGRAVAWVHGVTDADQARRLGAERPAATPLNVCLQVNADGDPAKAGVAADAVPALAQAVHRVPGVRLRGLMTIPALDADPAPAFARVRALFDALRADGLELDTVSMGMSADLEPAVAHGATLVRVGTALFGPREAAT